MAALHGRPPGSPEERALVIATAEAAGAQGVYVLNSLSADEPGDDVHVLWDGDGTAVAVAWFGRRGNLIVMEREPFDVEAAARVLRAHDSTWRIALGPEPIVAALAAGERDRPLVDRWQVYYGVRPGGVPADRLRSDVRHASRHDTAALVHAALDLNHSDLNVPPWRVHRGWLKDSVRRRIRERRTFVIGAPGEPLCKLDIGSRGPAGAMVEGVHTVANARGRGLATGLVATVAAELLGEHALVCLHVAEQNAPARRAYRAAGMTEMGRCRILLRGS